MRDYFNDVRLRLSSRTDVKQLTPHGWREHFAAEVTERRRALLREFAASVAWTMGVRGIPNWRLPRTHPA